MSRPVHFTDVYHAWHRRGQYPTTCDICKQEQQICCRMLHPENARPVEQEQKP